MADLKSLNQLAEEWNLGRGHLEAVLAFEKIEPTHSYKQGNGTTFLYEPEALMRANERYVVAKMAEAAAAAQAKAEEGRKKKPVVQGEFDTFISAMEEVRVNTKGICDDVAQLFVAADDTRGNVERLFQQNKLLFGELTKVHDLLVTRFAKLERMVIANCDVVGTPAPAVYPGSPPDLVTLKTDQSVLESLRKVAVPPAPGPVAAPGPSHPEVRNAAMVAAEKEPCPPLGRPRVVILGLPNSHTAVIKKEFGPSLDLRFFESQDVRGAGFVSRITSSDKVFFMKRFMNDGNTMAILNSAKLDVETISGSVSMLKTALQRYWVLASSESLSKVTNGSVPTRNSKGANAPHA